MSVVFLLGNARVGEFEALRRGGSRVGLIRDVTSHSWCAEDALFDCVVPWTPSGNVTDLAMQLREYVNRGELGGVLNLRESYVEHFARLLTAFELPAMTDKHVARLRSKALMRSVFRSAIGAQATGRHAAATCAADVRTFGARHGWPVVIKPEALYSSLFVTTVVGPDEAVAAFTAMQRGIADHVRDKGLPVRFTRMQVEEYLSGSNHSVDLLINAAGVPRPTPVVDVLTSADLRGLDFSHFARFCPSRVTDTIQAQMQELACAAVRALGFRRCAAHVEFILTPQGPRLLEAAVRPGGHRIRMLEMAHGITFAQAYLAVISGRAPDLTERCRRPFAIVTPFPRSNGVFTGVRDVERVTSLESYRRHSVYAAEGTPIGLSTSGFWQVMAIELAADSAEVLRDDVTAIWNMPSLLGVRSAAELAGVVREASWARPT